MRTDKGAGSPAVRTRSDGNIRTSKTGAALYFSQRKGPFKRLRFSLCITLGSQLSRSQVSSVEPILYRNPIAAINLIISSLALDYFATLFWESAMLYYSQAVSAVPVRFREKERIVIVHARLRDSL